MKVSALLNQFSDLLRHVYKPSEYERVLLPLVLLRRFDCVLESTREAVIKRIALGFDTLSATEIDFELQAITGYPFYHRYDRGLAHLKENPLTLAQDLKEYIAGFSSNVCKLLSAFQFDQEINKLDRTHLLHLAVTKICDVDLHPEHVDSTEMIQLFEEMVRQFSSYAHETGDYFTPSEVTQLMVEMLFAFPLGQSGEPLSLYDPTCGMGGMLFEAARYLRQSSPQSVPNGIEIQLFGQEINQRIYTLALAEAILQGTDGTGICYGDTLTNDQFPSAKFTYSLANPPFGVDWKCQQKHVQQESLLGIDGRFGAGLPRVSDGALLFVQHLISKFSPTGSRAAIVLNASPLFTGGAGSGESDIRRWLLESDLVEAIIALPENLFHNTAIGSYVWILSNIKSSDRASKIQLIDAKTYGQPLRRSQGEKRRYLGVDDIQSILRQYILLEECETSKIFAAYEFGYRHVPVERPLRLTYQLTVERKSRFLDAVPHRLDDVQEIDRILGRDPIPDWNHVQSRISRLLQERGSRWRVAELKLFRTVFTEISDKATPVIAQTRKSQQCLQDSLWGWFPEPSGELEHRYEPNPDLRDFESIPLAIDPDQFFRDDVLPHVSDAWMVGDGVKVGYEINFNRYFYKFTPLRSLEEITADIHALTQEISVLSKELF